MKKAFAFLRRDIQEILSYKLAFLGQFIGIFFSLVSFFFLSRLIGNTVIPSLSPYGGKYFPFALIGIAFSNYLMIALSSFASTISSAQTTGTLEALLCTQTEIPTILIASSFLPFLRGSIYILLYLVIGALFFGVQLAHQNLLGALLLFSLTVISFGSIGIISASFVMVFKKGDPLMWFFGAGSTLLGGVMYPVSIMPGWLQKTAQWFPLTHSLEGIRRALLMNASLKELLPPIQVLGLFAIILCPVSVFVFSQAVKKAKRDGTLTQF